MVDFARLNPGVLCTSTTPFTKTGRLDEGAWRAHLQWVAQGGCMGINVAGAGFGQGNLMTDIEVYRLYEITVEELKGRICCSAANIEHPTATGTIAWARMAHIAGMDMIRIYPCNPGHSITPTRRMLDKYYREVLSVVDFMAVMLSSNVETGFEVPAMVHLGLLNDYPQIVAFSKIHNNPSNISEYVLALGRYRPVFTTWIGYVLITMFMGEKGWHTPLANLTPRLCSNFFSAYQSGDMKGALGYYVLLHQLESGLSGLAREWNILPVYQEAGRQLGLAIGAGYSRKPYLAIDDRKTKKAIGNLIDELEIRHFENLS